MKTYRYSDGIKHQQKVDEQVAEEPFTSVKHQQGSEFIATPRDRKDR